MYIRVRLYCIAFVINGRSIVYLDSMFIIDLYAHMQMQITSSCHVYVCTQILAKVSHLK